MQASPTKKAHVLISTTILSQNSEFHCFANVSERNRYKSMEINPR